MATSSKKSETEEIAEQLAALKADLAELTSAVGGLVETKAKSAKDTVKDKGESLAEEAARTAERAGVMVGQNPASALGIAAAVGFLVGYMASRR